MEDLWGDLAEMFYQDTQRMSAWRAKIRYWNQSISLMFSYAVSRRKEQQSYHAYSYKNFNTAMIFNYLVVSLRSLMKSKLYILVNIFGLAIAAGCCIVAYYNFHFNADFDTNFTNAGNIYRISSLRDIQGNQKLHGVTPIALGNLIRQNIPEAGKVTRYNYSQVSLKLDDNLFNEEIRYVDADFFALFEFQFLHGHPPSSGDKHKLYISDQLALKLFNTTDVVGRSVAQILSNEKLKPYEIGGVYKEQPMNSSFVDAGYALYDNYFDENSLDENSWQGMTALFVQIDDPSRLAVAKSRVQDFVSLSNKANEDLRVKEFAFDCFRGMAVRDEQADTQQRWTHPAISSTSTNGCVIMAVLIMLIACFNLTNTTLAISSRRVKEIGVRKVMGSQRRQLIFQFLGETSLVCFVAFVLGLWLTSAFLLPAFNSLWPYMKLQTNYFGDSGLLTSMLVIFVATVIAFIQNAQYQRSINLGFDRQVIYAHVTDGKEAELLMNELKEERDIVSIAMSRHSIGWSIGKATVKAGTTEIEADLLGAGDHYLQTAGITLTGGRDFTLNSETDKTQSVIVSEAFVEAMGWHDAIGQKVVMHDTVALYVIGTIKNIYSRGLWRKLEPMMIRYVDKAQCQYVTVSTEAENLPEMYAFMQERWKKIFPNKQFTGRYLDDIVAEGIAVNNNIVKMFVFVGAVAILLSSIGLFTMVSLTIVKRFKEIGIRMVLGASSATIARLINAKFVLVLVIASALGSWMSIFMLEAMMQGIWVFYQAPDVITLGSGVLLLFVIAAVTIGSKIYQVMRMNPATSLRSE